jgi:peptide/nickel transport system substrate-binding protein
VSGAVGGMAALLRAPLVVAVAALWLAACAEAPSEAVRFGLASMPTSLDPRFATDAASARVNRLLYARLVDFDDASRAIPSLATWTVVTPTHYRFKLGDEGREFHDGSRLSAADVKATYEFILNPDNGSPHRTALALIERIEVRDEDTVDFYLDRPDPLFPGYLVVGILPARLIAASHRFADRPVGSGPFALMDWPEEGRLRLRRRADGQVVELLRVPDPTVRALKLLRGEIDLLQNDLPPELVRFLADQDGVRVERRGGSNFTYLGFNLADPVTGRLPVRRAIAYALDRDAIIRHVLGGATQAEALLPPGHWAGNPDLQPYAHDPDKARQLLKEAGFDSDRPIELVYKTSADPFRVRLATIIQHQLAGVGIDVDLRSYDWGTFYGDIKAGRFQMYSLSWVGIKTPDIFRYVFHSESVPPNGANRGRYRSPVADRLIEAADATALLDERSAYYRRLQARLLDELPYVPLWYEDHFYARRAGIEGYVLAADGNYDGLITVRRHASAAQEMIAGPSKRP